MVRHILNCVYRHWLMERLLGQHDSTCGDFTGICGQFLVHSWKAHIHIKVPLEASFQQKLDYWVSHKIHSHASLYIYWRYCYCITDSNSKFDFKVEFYFDNLFICIYFYIYFYYCHLRKWKVQKQCENCQLSLGINDFNYLWNVLKQYTTTCSVSAKKDICHQWRICVTACGRVFSYKKDKMLYKGPMNTAFCPGVLKMGRKRVWYFQIMRRNMHAGISN